MGTRKDVDDNILLEQDFEMEHDKPHFYMVLLFNDDFTPMNFVVDVLRKFFDKSDAMAQQIMMTIHTQGEGQCGLYTREIAETKVMQVVEYARMNDYPLHCDMRAL